MTDEQGLLTIQSPISGKTDPKLGKQFNIGNSKRDRTTYNASISHFKASPVASNPKGGQCIH